MDKTIITQLKGFAAVRRVADEIARIFLPKRIYLYNNRLSMEGIFTSFKLCVVGEFDDKEEAECEIYNQIDSDIPFDVLLYTTPEWEELSLDEMSFAGKIIRMGTVLYG